MRSFSKKIMDHSFTTAGLKRALKDIEDEKIGSVDAFIPAEENTNGLSVTMDLRGKNEFSIYIELEEDNGSEVRIYQSHNGIDFFLFKVFSMKGRYTNNFKTNFRYIKVDVLQTQISIRIVITK